VDDPLYHLYYAKIKCILGIDFSVEVGPITDTQKYLISITFKNEDELLFRAYLSTFPQEFVMDSSIYSIHITPTMAAKATELFLEFRQYSNA
jgi:hypothetical protein